MSILPLLLRRNIEGAIKRPRRESDMIHKGSCHCGNIAFEVEGDLSGAAACNCSICSRKGALLWAVDADKLRVLDPQAEMGEYTFNNHAIRHRFCRNCGIHTHAEGDGWTAVNIRCLDGFDPAAVTVIDFDGRSA